MSLGLTNAKLASQPGTRPNLPRVKPARTSIAEDAIFIPKPHKRVKFKISTGNVTDGAKNTAASSKEPLPLPGQNKANPEVSGNNIATGSLGKNGITAQVTATTYNHGAKYAPRVEMEVDYTPEKDGSVIVTQEEGRQTHNAGSVHYSQQYDAYGRPRIGFSREPYDFAAIKFMVKTSQIRFQQNVESTQAEYEKYRYNPQEELKSTAGQPPQANLLGPEVKTGEMLASDPAEQPMLAANPMIAAENGQKKPEDMELLGKGSEPEPGMIDPAQAQEFVAGKGNSSAAKDVEKTNAKNAGLSAVEVAKRMGIEIGKILSPANSAEVAAAHDVEGLEEKSKLSVSV